MHTRNTAGHGADPAELRGVLTGVLFGGLLADPWALPLCQDAAPGLVDLDDWGYAGLLGDGTVTRDQQGQAREAAAVYPVAALKVHP